MALSDVLSETVERLESDSHTYLHSDFYKKFYPKEIRDAVTNLLDEMDSIRAELDAPPVSDKPLHTEVNVVQHFVKKKNGVQ
jgi:hypothetical protein